MSKVTKVEVVEVFGKFAINTGDGIQMFDTKEEANSAAFLLANEAEFSARAASYCDANNLTAKNAAAKTKIIKDFLAFEAAKASETPAE